MINGCMDRYESFDYCVNNFDELNSTMIVNFFDFFRRKTYFTFYDDRTPERKETV